MNYSYSLSYPIVPVHGALYTWIQKFFSVLSSLFNLYLFIFWFALAHVLAQTALVVAGCGFTLLHARIIADPCCCGAYRLRHAGLLLLAFELSGCSSHGLQSTDSVHVAEEASL